MTGVLQKEMAKGWGSVSKNIHGLFSDAHALNTSKAQGIGWQTILKFLGGSWKARTAYQDRSG